MKYIKLFIFYFFLLKIGNIFVTEKINRPDHYNDIIKEIVPEDRIKEINHIIFSIEKDKNSHNRDYTPALYEFFIKVTEKLKELYLQIKKNQENYSATLSKFINFSDLSSNEDNSKIEKIESYHFSDMKELIKKISNLEENIKNDEKILLQSQEEALQLKTIYNNIKKTIKKNINFYEKKYINDQKYYSHQDKKLTSIVLEYQDKIEELKEYISLIRLYEKEISILYLKEKINITKNQLVSLDQKYKKSILRFHMSLKEFNKILDKNKEIIKKLLDKKEIVLSNAKQEQSIIDQYKSELKAENNNNYDFIFYVFGLWEKEKNIFQKAYYADILLTIINHFYVFIVHESESLFFSVKIKEFQKDIDLATTWMMIGNPESNEKDLKNAILFLENDVLQGEDKDFNLQYQSIYINITEIQKIVLLIKQYSKDLKKEKLGLASSFNNIIKKLETIDEFEHIAEEKINSYFLLINEIHKDIYIQTAHLIKELKERNFWKRSQHSIGKSQLKQFIPDIRAFITHIYSDFMPCVKNIILIITNKKSFPTHNAIIFFLIIFCSIFIGLLGYKYSFRMYSYLLFYSQQSTFLARLSLFISFFMNQSLLYPWFICFIIFKYNIITSAYLGELFYLFSIPYYIYISYYFMQWFYQTNNSRGFVFISSEYINRFFFVASIFLYSSVPVYFLSTAFSKSSFIHSSVPTVLLAFYFILIQVILISLIRKEQIVNFISNEGAIANAFKYIINKYYIFFFFFLITIIIMSNPYVGYGKQVIYIISRMIITGIFIPILMQGYDLLKKGASNLFFYYTDQDIIQNRIPGGRSWYAFSVICSFVGLCIFCYFFIGKIWGLNISYESIKWYFNYNFMDSSSFVDNHASLSLATLTKIFAFIVMGYITTYILNVFILQRILDPLMIGAGLQNTVITLSRYILVIIFFLLGLHNTGLDSLTTKIAFVVGAIGFALKEPFADLIAYFIILVQRPIKIGDFIKINSMDGHEIIGIIRQITPRTTLIRQNNSHTIILPNSFLITKSLINWNYVKGFVSTEDILLHIEFTYDPEFIKQTLLKIIEQHPAILKNPAPVIRCRDFTSSGYQFMIRGYINSDRASDLFEISSQVRILVGKKLLLQGIKLSIPHYIIQKKEIIKSEELNS